MRNFHALCVIFTQPGRILPGPRTKSRKRQGTLLLTRICGGSRSFDSTLWSDRYEAGPGRFAQPGRLPEGSRGSQPRCDPRSTAALSRHPGRGARESCCPSGTPPGCRPFNVPVRGSRLASTPGYLLSSLRDEVIVSTPWQRGGRSGTLRRRTSRRRLCPRRRCAATEF